MKKVVIISVLCLLGIKHAVAQSGRININVTTPGFKGGIGIYDKFAAIDQAKRGFTGIALDSHQTGSYAIGLTEPRYITLTCYEKALYYNIFLSPGDDISIKIDLNKKDKGIVVTGKGSNNNQPAIAELTGYLNMKQFASDTLPNRLIAAINKLQIQNKIIIKNYISLYKPSAAFIKTSWLNLNYFAAETFYTSKEDNKFGQKYNGYEHNIAKWNKIQDSLFAVAKLNNDAALSSANYTTLIDNFVMRENERLRIVEEPEHTQLFYKEWYHTNVAKGKKLFNTEKKDLLSEKIINKYFTGKAAEYLYFSVIKYNLYVSNYKNISALFDHFKQRYPNSFYLNLLKQPINEIVQKQSQKLTDKMIFVANNGTNLNTLKDIIALNKGKTVFIDMWGTWCGPCREDIEKDSEKLRSYFKGKDVVFIYIDNQDSKNEQQWKKLIAYYHMEGTHILANDKLTNSIMGSIKATGFPTYMIIKKDGTYKGAKSQYPMDLQGTVSELKSLL
jgi:thiol-disulfide isomerase/thioredoxin